MRDRRIFLIATAYQLLGVWLLLVVVSGIVSACQSSGSRSFHDRQSSGRAPRLAKEPEAIVQIYGARAARWRSYFAVHTWIAVKDKDSSDYEVLQVIGWELRRSGSALVRTFDIPDRRWFGADPELYFDLRGPGAEAAIPRIREIAKSYPHEKTYRAWPGPNSNTFVAHVIRNTPELTVELPANAIGKDWIVDSFFARSESGSGLQISGFGLLGLTLGWAEGIEINILGLALGIDFRDPALKLPMLGRLGTKDSPL